MNLSDLIERNAAFAPTKPAMHFEGTTLTYAAFALVCLILPGRRSLFHGAGSREGTPG